MFFRNNKKIKWPHKLIWRMPKNSKKAEKMANLVYRSCGLEDLNINESFVRMYRLGRFNVEYNSNISYAGQMFPEEENRFRIQLKPYLSTMPLDKIILHEIGHSFFFSRYRTDTPSPIYPFHSNGEEIFCNEFADNLLKLIEN